MNNKAEQEARRLLASYEAGQCTPREKAVVESWLNQVSAATSQPDGEPDYERLKQQLYPKIKDNGAELYKFWKLAAAVLVVVSAGIYFFIADSGKPVTGNSQSDIVSQDTAGTVDIPPGSNKAMLTLANGTNIDLSSAQDGIIIAHDEIKYADGSALIENGKLKVENDLQLSTPKGGQYQVILPDGTKVWLNAASTLRYPSKFTGDNRVVELEGEAYFSVDSRQSSAASKKPFIVKSKGQEIIVLGTEFNINAYHDEANTKTTLVSGAVKVSTAERSTSQLSDQSIILSPNQQAIFTGNRLTKQDADLNSEISWKSGSFYFKDTPLADMMRQIARWYDIDVVYNRTIPNEFFTGEMNRNVNLQTVLDFLRGSDIRFQAKGRQLIFD